MRTFSIISFAILAAACDPTGTCITPASSARMLAAGCMVNYAQSDCADEQGEFVASSGAEGVTVCQTRGFIRAQATGGGDLTPDEIEEELSRGPVYFLAPPGR